MARCSQVRNHIGLVLYLAGGWRTYADISKEFGWVTPKTAHRNVRALEESGLPVEWATPPDQIGGFHTQSVRLAPDWVARTTWLRRYITIKQPATTRKEYYT